uniref:Uncharacterized protein n=1 Tax=Chromera velia CCMP2878 TaxID=1169474 RepID=A0A0G4F7I5_9ALVE|eukprot:Cvel_15644.t1-p1 / transcript=Cvel_15644.t1 / gene=Cvel_15644 / organism=Chromera_velia_CCMP2878 / gene_product=hypothetical protein / transcript_product=hypothetical protein / location=Cvel_scaffold1166:51443-52138(+) / protein_length=232 / sequence_SO=supercontig / SO=protein_coding / is_pseudo=false
MHIKDGRKIDGPLQQRVIDSVDYHLARLDRIETSAEAAEEELENAAESREDAKSSLEDLKAISRNMTTALAGHCRKKSAHVFTYPPPGYELERIYPPHVLGEAPPEPQTKGRRSALAAHFKRCAGPFIYPKYLKVPAGTVLVVYLKKDTPGGEEMAGKPFIRRLLEEPMGPEALSGLQRRRDDAWREGLERMNIDDDQEVVAFFDIMSLSDDGELQLEMGHEVLYTGSDSDW